MGNPSLEMNEILLCDILIHPLDSEYPRLLLVLKFVAGDVADKCRGRRATLCLRCESIFKIREKLMQVYLPFNGGLSSFPGLVC